jgi:hypothetical protein
MVKRLEFIFFKKKHFYSVPTNELVEVKLLWIPYFLHGFSLRRMDYQVFFYMDFLLDNMVLI